MYLGNNLQGGNLRTPHRTCFELIHVHDIARLVRPKNVRQRIHG